MLLVELTLLEELLPMSLAELLLMSIRPENSCGRVAGIVILLKELLDARSRSLFKSLEVVDGSVAPFVAYRVAPYVEPPSDEATGESLGESVLRESLGN